jgi:hypothetical protein
LNARAGDIARSLCSVLTITHLWKTLSVAGMTLEELNITLEETSWQHMM